MFEQKSTIVERLHIAHPELYAEIIVKEETSRDLFAYEFRGNTALHEAAVLNNVQLVTHLVQLGCLDVNARNKDDETPLIRAAKLAEDDKSISEVTKVLLEAGADPLVRDRDKRRAVEYCLEKEDLESAKLLRNFSQKLFFDMIFFDNWNQLVQMEQLNLHTMILEYRDDNGDSLLHYSVTAGNVELTRFFLACGIDVNDVGFISRLTPLIYAAMSRRRKWKSEVIKLLLEAGADITATDSNGYTALHLCVECTKGDTKSVGLLLVAGIDVNNQQKLSQMRTPLLVASQRGDIEVMLLLLQRGADPRLCSIDGENPLNSTIAAFYPPGPSHRQEALVYHNILELLLTYGADPNEFTARFNIRKNSISAFMHILSVGDVRQVQLFLNHGADPRLMDAYGQTGLHYAAHNPDSDVLELLLDFLGADSAKEIRRKSELGDTVLNIAVKLKHLDNIRLLCESGADVNVVAKDGQTPLLYLLSHKSRGLPCFVDQLLWYGADPFAKIASGKTAYQLALKLNKPKVTQLILRYAVLKIVRHRYGKSSHEELKNQDAETLRALTGNRMPHNYFVKCTEELNRMQASVFYDSVSFLDILACSHRQLLSYLGNDKLVSKFKSRMYSVKMPIFGDTIRQRFYETMIEKKTLIVAKQVLKELLPVCMCNLVLEQILSYLTERELKKVAQDRMILFENYVFNPIIVSEQGDISRIVHYCV